MTSFLERYLQGECEPVWDELVALGEEVQIEPLHADALAVARETMRRARSNIEALIPRLQKLGYTFGYDWLPANERDFAKNKPPLYALPGPNVPARLAELERVAEGIPLSIRAWYEAIGAVNFVGIPPLHWPLPPWREGLQRFFEEHSHYPDWMIKQQWQEGETKWVGFHTACRQFIETHPSYPDYTLPELWHFEQDHPGLVPLLRQIGTWLDPLQVWSLEDQLLNAELTGYQEWEATYSEAPDFPRCICIAPDNLTKQEISGGSGYEIVVPCLAADARLEGEPHQTTFVNYLRLCFRWCRMKMSSGSWSIQVEVPCSHQAGECAKVGASLVSASSKGVLAWPGPISSRIILISWCNPSGTKALTSRSPSFRPG